MTSILPNRDFDPSIAPQNLIFEPHSAFHALRNLKFSKTISSRRPLFQQALFTGSRYMNRAFKNPTSKQCLAELFIRYFYDKYGLIKKKKLKVNKILKEQKQPSSNEKDRRSFRLKVSFAVSGKSKLALLKVHWGR